MASAAKTRHNTVDDFTKTADGFRMSMEHSVTTYAIEQFDHFLFRPMFYAVFFDHLWRPLYVANTFRGMMDMAANLKQRNNRLYCIVDSDAVQQDDICFVTNVKYVVEDGNFRCLSRDILFEDQMRTDLQFLVDEERDRRNTEHPVPLTLRLLANHQSFTVTDELSVRLVYDIKETSNESYIHNYEFCRVYQIRNFTLNTPPLYTAITEQEYKDKVRQEEDLFYNYISTHKEPHSSTDHVWRYIIKPMLDTPINYLVFASKPPSRKRKAN